MTGEAHPEWVPSQAPDSNAPVVGWGVGRNKYLQRLLGVSPVRDFLAVVLPGILWGHL